MMGDKVKYRDADSLKNQQFLFIYETFCLANATIYYIPIVSTLSSHNCSHQRTPICALSPHQ